MAIYKRLPRIQIDPNNLDPQALELTKAIRLQESSWGANKESPLSKKEGVIGYYQYKPETWKRAGDELLGGVALDGKTPLNIDDDSHQNLVTYAYVKARKDQGYFPKQILKSHYGGIDTIDDDPSLTPKSQKYAEEVYRKYENIHWSDKLNKATQNNTNTTNQPITDHLNPSSNNNKPIIDHLNPSKDDNTKQVKSKNYTLPEYVGQKTWQLKNNIVNIETYKKDDLNVLYFFSIILIIFILIALKIKKVLNIIFPKINLNILKNRIIHVLLFILFGFVVWLIYTNSCWGWTYYTYDKLEFNYNGCDWFWGNTDSFLLKVFIGFGFFISIFSVLQRIIFFVIYGYEINKWKKKW